MPRNNKRMILVNNVEYYAPLRRSRDVSQIRHYETPIMNNPTAYQRSAIQTNKHIWKYGDRLYNLADQYYGDATFWWVIAWWNGYGIEGDIRTGALLYIPLDISKAIKVLGV